jgi:hypothetical protein
VSLLNDDLDYRENTQLMEEILKGVGSFILSNRAFGFEDIDFGLRSISRACRIAGEVIFNSHFFPDHPGPFKRAAAAAILTRCYVDMQFKPAQGGEGISADERIAWRSRVAFLTIDPILSVSSLPTPSGAIQLGTKRWYPATSHLKLELLALLRWLDDFKTPDGELSESRLCRAVMALAMIIEQSYYLREAQTNCPVMGQGNCLPESENPIGGWDLWFDIPVG